MESTDTVRCILARKGNRVISVPPEASVLDALTRMAGEDVGAVAVMKDGHLLGAFTERDYARKLVLLGRSSAETSVAEAMTQPATCVRPETTVDDCMRGILVTRSRHLF
ncbi:MAG TPA: CBS domain-containing protein, partial [Bryobacteraceae bacterium]|nr:CBS domain-containing protein [Bryobacteraceae bacterium]